jgi:signal transduction histidine kinase
MVVRKISAGEDVVEAEMVGRRCDGSLVPVAMSVRRVVDQDGPIHEGVLVDLTDRKRAEEAAALRSVAALANAAAHEINNPLTVLIGNLERLNDAGDPAGRIERMRAAIARIGDIVSHMAHITRLEPADQSAELPRMLDIRRSGREAE